MKLIFVLALIVGCATSNGPEEKSINLTIFHTNDHHGHYLKDGRGQYGMAARKTLLDKLRKEVKEDGGHSLLLSGGDINTGTMESDVFDAKPDFLGMNKLKYDAMAVGNHEFDNSYKVIKQQKKWAGFPFLSANIFWKGTKKRVFNPTYIIKEMDGVKVGIFGLTTIDTPFKASHVDAKNLFDFKPITDTAKEVVKELKPKVDFIIVVTHVGHHGSATSNGDIALAKAVDGIDVIVGGHSQEIINAEVHNGTIIVQAEDWGKYLGKLDLKVTKNNTDKSDFDYKLIPVNLKKKVNGKRVYIEKEIPENKEMLALFEPFKKEADRIGSKVVGTLDRDLDGNRTKVRSQQMPIAQFMGGSMLWKFKNIDVGVLNGGSIRSSLKAGNISRKSIHGLHPYGNAIVTVEFSKEEFFEYMSVIAKKAIVDTKFIIGGYPQLLNMKITLEKGELVSVESTKANWKVYKDTNGKIQGNRKKITLGSMNFLARGGDDYPVITKHPTYTDTGFMINSTMMEYVEKIKKVRLKNYKIDSKKIVIIK